MILIIDDKIRKSINDLIEYSNQNIFKLQQLKGINEGNKNIPGDLPCFRVFLPTGIKVVYTVEEGMDNKIYKHLSASYNGKPPSPMITEEIIKEFKFENELFNCFINMEEYTPGCFAVNVWEEFKND